MNIWQTIGLKSKGDTGTTQPGGDVIEREGVGTGIYKSYIPNFLYKPPFGYPRQENIPLLRQFARNPYVYSIIKSIAEQAAATGWDIVKDEEYDGDVPDEAIKDIKNFLKNPNANKEGFDFLLKAAVKDICELDSGVWVKVFNKNNELVELYARDGGTFLKNPDPKGIMGDRVDIIMPDGSFTMGSNDQENMIVREQYQLKYGQTAAYFQYGWTAAALPVPFGKQEIVYFMSNPRSDSVYGVPPIAILSDIILTLVYGSQYNLDIYMNSNVPEGIIQLDGASQAEIKAFKARFEQQFRVKDSVTGFMRKVGFKFPITNRKAEITPFQLPAKEMQIIEQQQWFTKIAWMCFGVTAEEMGFTENSNKAVSETQTAVAARKAVTPILKLIEERINREIIPEFGVEGICFRFDDYDINHEMKKFTLYEQQIRMGVLTPEMVANEEGIDLEELKQYKEEKLEMESRYQMNQFGGSNNNPQEKKEEKEEKEEKPEVKAKKVDEFANTELELEMMRDFNKKSKLIEKMLRTTDLEVLDGIE